MITRQAPPFTRQALIFDADDTLWPCLAVYQRVIDDYFDWLAHPGLNRVELRILLDDIERAQLVTRGYGSRAFLANLADHFRRLRERHATVGELAEIERMATDLLDFRVRLLPGVLPTLDSLGARHDLYLLTKGERVEQQRKIDSSGLVGRFRAVRIVAEKDVSVYRSLAEQHGLDPARTWMIGNSPGSDIAPARAAGLSAVYIPHEVTWSLDAADLDLTDQRILTLSTFSDLLQHF